MNVEYPTSVSLGDLKCIVHLVCRPHFYAFAYRARHQNADLPVIPVRRTVKGVWENIKMEHVEELEHTEDIDDAPHHSIQGQLARAVFAGALIAVAAWMVGSYLFDALGLPFLAK